MDNIRIAILDAYDTVCAYLDNSAPKALHYHDDELHEYLKGTATTYTFTTSADHEDSLYLIVGNKLAFRNNNRDYYLNIMQIVRDEYTVEVTAYSLLFELLNEQKDAYAATGAMTFSQYLNVFDYEKVVTLNINEVSNKSIKNEWTGTESMLARLYSLATVFDAELEFAPHLNDDYSLNKIVMNVYQAHSETVQGVGTDRTELVLRYGKDVSGITKTSDIAGLYTAIRPIGRDGLTVSSLNKTEYDADGSVEYTSPSGNRNIYAVQARDRFPSNTTANVNERYIAQVWNYDTDNVNMLYGQALAELKKNCVPQVKYEVKGYFDTGIGDTVSIADEEWNPPLYLQARVTEQIRSFTNPALNKTVFDNFKELQSQIDPSLLAAMNALIEANKVYTSSILSNNGIVFKNGQGSTTLTASVMDVGKDMTDSLTIRWYKDGVTAGTGKTITIPAATITGKAVFRFEAADSNDIVRGFYEVTVSNVDDGTGRIFILESSEDIIRRSLDGTLSSQYIDFSAFYRAGESVEKHPFAGKFVIEETTDGSTWTTAFENSTDTDSVRYYMMWLLGDSEGNALGDADGNALGADFRDVVMVRCRFFSGDTMIGVKSVAVLKDGDPTGIIESGTPPADPYDGMLWKNTGENGLLNGSTYYWKNNDWEIYTFRAENIEAHSFKGYEFDGSVFKSDFLVPDGLDRYFKGTATMDNGVVRVDYKEYSGETVLSEGYSLLSYAGIETSNTSRGSFLSRFDELSLSNDVQGSGKMTPASLVKLSKTPDIQKGTVTSITVAANSSNTVSVTFGNSFDYVPVVVASTTQSAVTGEVSVYNITKTGFTARISNRNATQYVYGIQWIAMATNQYDPVG